MQNSAASRVFEDYEAATATKPMPLIVGITSPSGGGKTFSALALAEGMRRITGGEVFGIDTESDRMLHYKTRFNFRHVPFAPPHSPADYEKAVDYCLGRGAKVVIVDSMTHEHSGEGGVLDMTEEFLQRKAGDDYDRREKLKWTAQIEPKAQRRRLNLRVVGAKACFILCYRAQDKTKPVAGGKPVHLGWQAETTSPLPYEMTVRFLLPPGSDGHPNLTPDTEFERLSIKNPVQFREWFQPGFQLTADVGERLARWAAGGSSEGIDDVERKALLDEVQATLLRLHPGQEKADKRARLEAMKQAFSLHAWAAVSALTRDGLRAGLDALQRPVGERTKEQDFAEEAAAREAAEERAALQAG
jgi:hypothetical protein